MSLYKNRTSRWALALSLLISPYSSFALAPPSKANSAAPEGSITPTIIGKVVLLPHLESTHQSETSEEVSKSDLPAHIKKLVADKKYAVPSLWALHEAGWNLNEIRARIASSSSRFQGLLVRPMRKDELELLDPILTADMTWLSVDGVILKRPLENELGTLTAGLNLAKSYGLTQTGRKSAENMASPVFEKWRSSDLPKSIFSTIWAFAAMFLTGVFVSILALPTASRYSGERSNQVLILSCSLASILTACVTLWLYPLCVAWLPQIVLILSAILIFATTAIIFKRLDSTTSASFSWGKSGQFNPSRLLGETLLKILAIFSALSATFITILSVLPITSGGLTLMGLAYAAPFLSHFSPSNFKSKFDRLWPLKDIIILCLALFWTSALLLFSMTIPHMVEFHLSTSPEKFHIDFLKSPENLVAFSFALIVVVASVSTLMLKYANVTRKITLEQCPLSLSKFGLVDVALFSAIAIFSAIAATPMFIKGELPAMSIYAPGVPWEEALSEDASGRAVIVDARAPGSLPEIPSFANLDPLSDDETLRNFCAFTEGKKIYIFCSSSTCDISREMAQRMGEMCPEGVYHIEGGAEKWSTK